MWNLRDSEQVEHEVLRKMWNIIKFDLTLDKSGQDSYCLKQSENHDDNDHNAHLYPSGTTAG